jgi:hypothetical protein
MVAADPLLPALDASGPMPLPALLEVSAEDSERYRTVAGRLNALQAWIRAELQRLDTAQ